MCSALSALCSAIFNLQIESIRSNDSIRSPHRRRESKGRKGGGGNPLHKMAAMAAVSQQKFGTKDSDEGGRGEGIGGMQAGVRREGYVVGIGRGH